MWSDRRFIIVKNGYFGTVKTLANVQLKIYTSRYTYLDILEVLKFFCDVYNRPPVLKNSYVFKY